MAFVRTAFLIAALVLSWVALRVEGSAHVAREAAERTPAQAPLAVPGAQPAP